MHIMHFAQTDPLYYFFFSSPSIFQNNFNKLIILFLYAHSTSVIFIITAPSSLTLPEPTDSHLQVTFLKGVASPYEKM
jgi:hypothetical protein